MCKTHSAVFWLHFNRWNMLLSAIVAVVPYGPWKHELALSCVPRSSQTPTPLAYWGAEELPQGPRLGAAELKAGPPSAPACRWLPSLAVTGMSALHCNIPQSGNNGHSQTNVQAKPSGQRVPTLKRNSICTGDSTFYADHVQQNNNLNTLGASHHPRIILVISVIHVCNVF